MINKSAIKANIFLPETNNNIRITRLANGLRIATDTMPQFQTVSVGVWVNVGTRHEPHDQNGIAHLLEHMMFKGTAKRSAQDISAEIESAGGHMNAYTSRENTAYYVRLLGEDLPVAVDILSDVLQHSTLPDVELERERTVILQELAQVEDTPDDIVLDYFQQTAYPEQTIGQPILGLSEVIQQVSRQQISSYQKKHYIAPNLLLVAAGNIHHESFVDLVQKTFQHLDTGNPSSITKALYRGGDCRMERTSEQTLLVLGFQAPSYHDDDFYALQLLSSVLGGGMSSRLFQEIREKRGLAYNIHSFTASYADSGLIGVYAGTGAQQATETIKIILDQILQLTCYISEDELQRAKRQLIAGIRMSQESVSARCEQLAQQILSYDSPLNKKVIEDILLQTTVEDLQNLLTQILKTPLTFTALGTNVCKLPKYHSLQEQLSGINNHVARN